MVPQPQPAAARPTPQPAPVRQPVPQPAAPAVQQPQQHLWLRSNKLCKLKETCFCLKSMKFNIIKHIKTWISLFLSFWFYVIYWYLITSRTKMTNSRVQLALGIQASQDGRLVSLVSLFNAPCSLCPAPQAPQAPQAAQAAQVRQAPHPASATVLPRRLQRVHQVENLRFLLSKQLFRNPNQKCIENSKGKRWYLPTNVQNMNFHDWGCIIISNPWRGWSLQRLGAFALKARGATEMKPSNGQSDF